MGEFVGLMHFQAPLRIGVGVRPFPQLTRLLNSRIDNRLFTQQSTLQTLTSALLKSLEMLLLRRFLPHCVRRQTAQTRPLVASQTANKQFRSSIRFSIITIRQFAALRCCPRGTAPALWWRFKHHPVGPFSRDEPLP